jgi:hypothetical protein
MAGIYLVSVDWMDLVCSQTRREKSGKRQEEATV